MKTTKYAALILMAAATAVTAELSLAQSSQIDRNKNTLRSYMQPHQVTRLEWELLQFNLHWSGLLEPHPAI